MKNNNETKSPKITTTNIVTRLLPTTPTPNNKNTNIATYTTIQQQQQPPPPPTPTTATLSRLISARDYLDDDAMLHIIRKMDKHEQRHPTTTQNIDDSSTTISLSSSTSSSDNDMIGRTTKRQREMSLLDKDTIASIRDYFRIMTNGQCDDDCGSDEEKRRRSPQHQRLTRGMRRDRKRKRKLEKLERENMGLEALIFAVKGLEEEVEENKKGAGKDDAPTTPSSLRTPRQRNIVIRAAVNSTPHMRSCQRRQQKQQQQKQRHNRDNDNNNTISRDETTTTTITTTKSSTRRTTTTTTRSSSTSNTPLSSPTKQQQQLQMQLSPPKSSRPLSSPSRKTNKPPPTSPPPTVSSPPLLRRNTNNNQPSSPLIAAIPSRLLRSSREWLPLNNLSPNSTNNNTSIIRQRPRRSATTIMSYDEGGRMGEPRKKQSDDGPKIDITIGRLIVNGAVFRETEEEHGGGVEPSRLKKKYKANKAGPLAASSTPSRNVSASSRSNKKTNNNNTTPSRRPVSSSHHPSTPLPSSSPPSSPTPTTPRHHQSLLISTPVSSTPIQNKQQQQPMISLGLLDWRRRQQYTPTSNTTTPHHHNPPPTPSSTRHTTPHSPPLSPGPDDSHVNEWHMIPPHPDVPKNPTLLQIPKRKHSLMKKSKWSRQLLHCLMGSGRSVARYEFFYSDLDRAWFTYRPTLASPHAHTWSQWRLTRLERSLLRRHLHKNKKKPRRFSPQFIQSQKESLERYRSVVRRLQNSDFLTEDFGYDVLMPIAVGSVVTACSKKGRILARGTVLTRDKEKKGYLVQFERKELGCEFCPDIEVASHGVPQVLRPAIDRAVDGSYRGGFAVGHSTMGALPYGTMYGPLVDFHKEQNRNAIAQVQTCNNQTSDVARALHSELAAASLMCDDHHLRNDAVVVDEMVTTSGTPRTTGGTSSAPTDNNNNEDDDDHRRQIATIESVAERETLVKLMGLMDAAVERKSLILDAIESCHDEWERHHPDCDVVVGDKNDENVFLAHYAWLHDNLRLTNQSLRAGLLYLQVMYSRAYSGRPPPLPHPRRCRYRSAQLSHCKNSSYATKKTMTNDVEESLKQCVLDDCQKLGNDILAQLETNNDDSNNNGNERRSNDVDDKTSSHNRQLLLSATNLLLVAQLCATSVTMDDNETNDKQGLNDCRRTPIPLVLSSQTNETDSDMKEKRRRDERSVTCLRRTLTSCLTMLTPSSSSSSIASNQCSDGSKTARLMTKGGRRSAFGDLKESVEMLCAALG